MTKKLFSTLFILAFLCNIVIAQKRIVSGVVKDKLTDSGLAFSSVQLSGSRLGTYTNEKGDFSLEIPTTYILPTLIISSVGYEKDTILLTKNKNYFTIYLKESEQKLNEIVITGVSKATLIKENPVAIVGISAKKIAQTSESNIIDVLVKNALGLSAVKTGANISKPFIRGLGYNRVLTLYDGIRQEGQQWGDEHGIEVDAYNINKAEVIKGPASLLYGSDAMAGVVSMFPYISSNKDNKIHGKFTSEYQTNNNLIGNGLRLDYSSQHFLAALSGSYRLAKNYRNAVDGRMYNTGFAEKNVSALVGYENAKGYSHLNFTFYDNFQGIPDGSRDSLTRKFTKQIYEGNEDDITDRPIVSPHELNSYQLSPLHQRIQHYRFYTNNFYALGKGDLAITLGLQQNIRREFNHPTLPKQASLFLKLTTVNYGIRYNAPKIANIETTVGINGMLQTNKNVDATAFPVPDYELKDGGMYVFSKWKNHNLTFSAGIRYDIRQVSWNDFYVKTNTESGFGTHIIDKNEPNAVLQFPAYQKTFTGISASFGTTYQFTKEISIKANIGRGYRAPNITEMASNGLDPGAHIIYLGNRKFVPEFSLQEDLGLRLNYPNFSAEMSVFNNNIQNYIYLQMQVDAANKPITDAQGNKTYQYQQAAAQLFGLEAQFAYHPEKIAGLRFENSLAIVNGFNRKIEYKNESINGKYLPLIPPLKILSSLSREKELKSKVFKSICPKVEIEYNATQNRYLGLNNSETRTPSFTLVNVGFTSELKFGKRQKIQFLFQINNVLDKVYQSNLSRLKYFEYYSQSPTGHLGIYNMGRNICFKIIKAF